MLETLAKLLPQDREVLLASLARRLLPQPVQNKEQLGEKEQNTLTEMRDHLGLSQDDNSQEAKGNS